MDKMDKKALRAEIDRLDYREQYGYAIRSTVYVLVVVVAFALLVATLFLPVLQVYGDSMGESLSSDCFVVATKTGHPHRGDVLAFYCKNKILIRRVIGLPYDEIEIDAQGNVTVNGEPLDEPYVIAKSLEKNNRVYPYTVPEGEYFVLADNRVTGTDSRLTAVGGVLEEDFVGVVRFKIWPLNEIGFVK